MQLDAQLNSAGWLTCGGYGAHKLPTPRPRRQETAAASRLVSSLFPAGMAGGRAVAIVLDPWSGCHGLRPAGYRGFGGFDRLAANRATTGAIPAVNVFRHVQQGWNRTASIAFGLQSRADVAEHRPSLRDNLLQVDYQGTGSGGGRPAPPPAATDPGYRRHPRLS